MQADLALVCHSGSQLPRERLKGKLTLNNRVATGTHICQCLGLFCWHQFASGRPVEWARKVPTRGLAQLCFARAHKESSANKNQTEKQHKLAKATNKWQQANNSHPANSETTPNKRPDGSGLERGCLQVLHLPAQNKLAN